MISQKVTTELPFSVASQR